MEHVESDSDWEVPLACLRAEHEQKSDLEWNVPLSELRKQSRIHEIRKYTCYHKRKRSAHRREIPLPIAIKKKKPKRNKYEKTSITNKHQLLTWMFFNFQQKKAFIKKQQEHSHRLDSLLDANGCYRVETKRDGDSFFSAVCQQLHVSPGIMDKSVTTVELRKQIANHLLKFQEKYQCFQLMDIPMVMKLEGCKVLEFGRMLSHSAVLRLQ